MALRSISRGCLNLAIDLAAGVSLVAMMGTGYILWFPLPPSTNRTHLLWGLSRHEWGSIHARVSMLMLALLAVHLVLHWEWLYGMLKRRFTQKASTGTREAARAGLVFLALFLLVGAGFAWVTQSGVRLRPAPLHELVVRDEAPREGSLASPTFVGDVWPIFEAACARCHGADRERGDFRADRREDYFRARPGGALVVPGAPEQSALLPLLRGEATNIRAIEAHRLQEDVLERVRAWIAAGAAWGS